MGLSSNLAATGEPVYTVVKQSFWVDDVVPLLLLLLFLILFLLLLLVLLLVLLLLTTDGTRSICPGPGVRERMFPLNREAAGGASARPGGLRRRELRLGRDQLPRMQGDADSGEEVPLGQIRGKERVWVCRIISQQLTS